MARSDRYINMKNAGSVILLNRLILPQSKQIDQTWAEITMSTDNNGLNQSTTAKEQMKENNDILFSGISILSYNLYLRPFPPFFNGQRLRSHLIPYHTKDYDIVVFQEVFDKHSRSQLQLKLHEYGFLFMSQTVGYGGLFKVNGGIFIASKFPIEQQQYRAFRDACSGFDCFADKSILYTKIQFNQTFFVHIFGTHLQAKLGRQKTRIRTRQIDIIKQFIDTLNISSNEPVIIAGDFNIDRFLQPDEYLNMLSVLNIKIPPYIGEYSFTFDSRTNDLIGIRHSDHKQECIDYVFYSKMHLQPKLSYQRILQPKTFQAWKEFNFEQDYYDLSDHYPVLSYYEF
ncbi:unnamed protein product [Didymodactylos carnosus]|uniref:sphingomyelin phosphodiesterase n=1 Tax=Didymodactylos carnosus TaxID=1234261 RepID=A0A814EA38_9BILA|nr:unnamed protein product [Didymodactylos carnosus]CAF0966632.1 unnamed protein product [Didymodactylos carnosus]CAF3725892.1 unnamed protein product [Didymodactylos carnosus]CAF3740132.1 unnamed protein product [Didymodactylos carnosus]